MNLKLEKPIVFFDLETTGVQVAKDRIVEIAILKVFPNGNKESKTWLVNPTIPIPEVTTAIHGISDEKVANEPTFKELAPEISELIHKRSLVMVFTDFIHSNKSVEEQFEAYKHLKHNKHEVILFYLSEPNTEIQLEFSNKPHHFIDIESGDEIKLSPHLLQKNYTIKAKNHLKELKLKCLQYKIELVEVDINKGFDTIINSYLLKRQKLF